MMIQRLFIFLLAPVLVLALLPGPAVSQQANPFAVAARVGDRVVTRFEVEQRARLLAVLNTPGDLEREALEVLIDERVREIAARRQGVRVSEDEVRAGIAEFASRFNLGIEELLEALEADGVAPETFRDFVRVGIAWNKAIGERFAGRLEVGDRDLDRAIARSRTEGRAAFLLSEIIVPYGPEFEEQARREVAQLARSLRTQAQFEQAARLYSRAATAAEGGRLDWIARENLAPGISRQISAMPVGAVTEPIDLPGALLLFLKRGVRNEGVFAAPPTHVTFARLRFGQAGDPATEAQARRIAERLTGCNDLRAASQTVANGDFAEQTVRSGAVPGLYATELARLEPGGVSLAVSEGGGRTILMLCGRGRDLDEAGREQLREQLSLQRLEVLGRTHFNQVRSTLEIVRP